MTRRVLLIAVVSLVWASGSEASEPAHAPAKPAAPAAAAAAKPQAVKAGASAHATEVAEPVVPAVKSAKRGKTARTMTGESLEELVARVKARLAEQQASPTRRPAAAVRPRTEDGSKLHLEWRPGVTWPTESASAGRRYDASTRQRRTRQDGMGRAGRRR